MPIEVKQMTIQSNINTNSIENSQKEEQNNPNIRSQQKQSPHDGEQYQAMKLVYSRLGQNRRER
ncbi:hypothetical protein [Marinomonas spartinae]|uniref:hypothetical protein n=1 Tax=Marinomonas spartinae TaxID=1792290 RepID=UPI00082B7214|nr:hypothetical protein [Marinomonas spartinae]